MKDLSYYRIIKILRDAYPEWVCSMDISKKTGIKCNIIGNYLSGADVEKVKTRTGTLYKLKNHDLHHLLLLLNEYIDRDYSNETKNVLREILMRLEQ